MISKKQYKKSKHIVSYLIIAVLVLIFSAPFYVSAENKLFTTTQNIHIPIMVSLGDSYSSGEGIPPFYGQVPDFRTKVKNEDWLAHRSQKSWPGQLSVSGLPGMMSKYKNQYWYFVAASGAKTEHLKNKHTKPYGRLSIRGDGELPPQLDVFKNIGGSVDYVTLTLGGNDAGFTQIITSAILDFNAYLKVGGLEDKLATTWNDFYKSGGIRDNLRTAYQDIEAAAGKQAKIIVAGYPQLIEPNGKGGFSTDEANLINDSVNQFNKEIENIVSSCKASGMKICFVSVEEKFKTHGAYSDNPFINEIKYGSNPEDLKDFEIASSYSIHPNEKGAEIYRECVQDKIDELEKDGGQSEWPTRTTSDERDIVLVLDVSGSMAGEPIDETKKAAANFINTALKEDVSIGIVTYDNSASMLSDFSVDEQTLTSIANNIADGGGTNIESGLAKAKEMLQESNAKKKIIVLMSDGEPNEGKVGDELVSYADSIKDDGTYIYTLGFFKSVGSGKSAAQILMEKIASDGCHYEVADADDLKFFFGDIADQINGQKYIYIRIACPVDVKVAYNGETLRSDMDNTKERTSFGSLTFEENQNSSENGGDNRIKILRLKDGADYDVQIKGNGTGKMNYTIGFMDETGEYSDMRKFKNLDISPKTQIETVASNSPSTVLKVDSDGDGKYDLKYKAKANSAGEIVDYSYILYIIYIAGILIILLTAYIAVKKWKRKSAEKAARKKALQKRFCVHCGNTVSGDKKFCPKCGNKME